MARLIPAVVAKFCKIVAKFTHYLRHRCIHPVFRYEEVHETLVLG